MQNAGHHISRLRDAGLIEVVDVWYSSRGREMDVFAPTFDYFVIYAGEAPSKDSLAAKIHTLESVRAIGSDSDR